jgi:hypothetical protein
MKNIKISMISMILIGLVIFQGCKKDPDPVTPTVSPKTNDSDQAGSAEMDEAMGHVNDMINNKIGGGSNYRMATYNLPCGVVSVDSSTTNSGLHKIYKINYGGSTPCGYKYKSGQISFELQNQTAFNIAGATFMVTFTDYTVEVKATGSIIKLNGNVNVTNQSGGYIWQTVTSSDTIIHKIRGSVNVTFSDGVVRPHSFYQLRTWKSSTVSPDWTGLSLTIAGDTLTNVIEIGKTKQGNYDYNTSATNAFVWKNCALIATGSWAGPYRLISGLARMNVTIPAITPTYIDVQGGYYWDYTLAGSTPSLVNDCTANAYKITTVIGTSTTSSYQLY